MKPPKSKVAPHPFAPDPDVPADPLSGKRACRVPGCRLMGEPGDAHHTMPEPIPDAASAAAGEGGER